MWVYLSFDLMFEVLLYEMIFSLRFMFVVQLSKGDKNVGAKESRAMRARAYTSAVSSIIIASGAHTSTTSGSGWNTRDDVAK